MRSKGERWILWDGREILITTSLANKHLRIMNESGKLEVIMESELRSWLNEKDFPKKIEEEELTSSKMNWCGSILDVTKLSILERFNSD